MCPDARSHMMNNWETTREILPQATQEVFHLCDIHPGPPEPRSAEEMLQCATKIYDIKRHECKNKCTVDVKASVRGSCWEVDVNIELILPRPSVNAQIFEYSAFMPKDVLELDSLKIEATKFVRALYAGEKLTLAFAKPLMDSVLVNIRSVLGQYLETHDGYIDLGNLAYPIAFYVWILCAFGDATERAMKTDKMNPAAGHTEF